MAECEISALLRCYLSYPLRAAVGGRSGTCLLHPFSWMDNPKHLEMPRAGSKKSSSEPLGSYFASLIKRIFSNSNYHGQGHVPPDQLPKAPSSLSSSSSRAGEYPFSKGCFPIKCYFQSPAIWEKAPHKRRGKINIIFQQYNGRFPLPKYFRAIFAQSQKNSIPKGERKRKTH